MTLVRAVTSGDVNLLRHILTRHAVDVNRRLETGETLLHLAVSTGNASIVKALLDAGADTNAAPTSGDVPLHQASALGLVDVVRLLYAHGADPTTPTRRTGETNLHLATRGGHLELVDFLLQHGASVNVKSRLRQTPLTVVVASEGGGDAALKVAKKLLQKGASVNGVGESDDGKKEEDKVTTTPLHLAVTANDVAMVRVLLEGGADVNTVDISGSSPLLSAAKCGDAIIVQLLLQAGADADLKGGLVEEEVRPWIGERRYCPLHIAATTGRADIAELLLEVGGATVDLPTTDFPSEVERPWCWIVHKETALHLAADGGHTELVRILTRRGACLENVDIEGNMPHHLSLHAAHHHTLHALLLRGSRIDARDGDRKPALHQAIRLGDARSVLLLLMHGASVSQRRKQGRSYIHMLAANPTWGPEVFSALFYSGNTTARLIRQPEVELFDLKLSPERRVIHDWLLAQDTSVHPLKILCRWLIRRLFRSICSAKSIWIFIDNLPLPAPLKRFLLLAEYNQYPVEYEVCPLIHKTPLQAFSASPVAMGFDY